MTIHYCYHCYPIGQHGVYILHTRVQEMCIVYILIGRFIFLWLREFLGCSSQYLQRQTKKNRGVSIKATLHARHEAMIAQWLATWLPFRQSHILILLKVRIAVHLLRLSGQPRQKLMRQSFKGIFWELKIAGMILTISPIEYQWGQQRVTNTPHVWKGILYLTWDPCRCCRVQALQQNPPPRKQTAALREGSFTKGSFTKWPLTAGRITHGSHSTQGRVTHKTSTLKTWERNKNIFT